MLAVDSRAPQKTKSPIKKLKRGELKSQDAGTLRTSVPDEECGLTDGLERRTASLAGLEDVVEERMPGSCCHWNLHTGSKQWSTSFMSPHQHCLITGILQKPGRSRTVGIYELVMQ